MPWDHLCCSPGPAVAVPAPRVKTPRLHQHIADYLSLTEQVCRPHTDTVVCAAWLVREFHWLMFAATRPCQSGSQIRLGWGLAASNIPGQVTYQALPANEVLSTARLNVTSFPPPVLPTTEQRSLRSLAVPHGVEVRRYNERRDGDGPVCNYISSKYKQKSFVIPIPQYYISRKISVQKHQSCVIPNIIY